MQIPRGFTIGSNYWTVALMPRLRNSALGRIYYSVAHIELATFRFGRRRPQRDLATTFWHEMTHAILHDMRHPLRDDEAFVSAFATRLSQAVRTAKL